MPKFGKTSKANLATCEQDLQYLFNEVIKHWDCKVLCGHRGEKEQNEAYYSVPRRSTKKWPNSKHNTLPSMAVDVAPWPIDWDDIDRFRRFAWFVKGIAVARGIEIRMGADWDGDNDIDDQTFHDIPHFELIKHNGEY